MHKLMSAKGHKRTGAVHTGQERNAARSCEWILTTVAALHAIDLFFSFQLLQVIFHLFQLLLVIGRLQFTGITYQVFIRPLSNRRTFRGTSLFLRVLCLLVDFTLLRF